MVVIIDVAPIIYRYYSYPQLQYVFYYCSLEYLISLVFSSDGQYDYSGIIYDELEDCLGEQFQYLDMDMMDVVINNVVCEIDEVLRGYLKGRYSDTIFVFDKWISQTAMLLKSLEY